MGRDTWRYRQQEEARKKKKRMNPVWRGVGCMVVVIFTLGGYLFSGWFLDANAREGWVAIPYSLVAPPPQLPWIPGGLLLKLGVALLFMVLGYGILSTVYAIAFPIKPGETDAPPIRRSGPPRR